MITGFTLPEPFRGSFSAQDDKFFIWHKDYPDIKSSGNSMSAVLKELADRIFEYKQNPDEYADGSESIIAAAEFSDG